MRYPCLRYLLTLEYVHSRMSRLRVIDTVLYRGQLWIYIFLYIFSRRFWISPSGDNGTEYTGGCNVFLFLLGHLCLRRERGGPVELLIACSV